MVFVRVIVVKKESKTVKYQIGALKFDFNLYTLSGKNSSGKIRQLTKFFPDGNFPDKVSKVCWYVCFAKGTWTLPGYPSFNFLFKNI